MAVTMIRGKSQIKANTIDVGRLEADFTAGSDWNHSNGSNDAVITGGEVPVNANDYTIKSYVDNLVNGNSWKESVKVIAVANEASLSGLALTIDGIDVDADGDRVLLTQQSTATENGVWIAHSGAWTRAADWPTGADASSYATLVEEGTAYADTAWVVTNDAGAATIATHTLLWAKFSNVSSGNTHVYNEEPAVTNGAAAIAALSNLPVASGTERVYLNGVRQREGASNDYTVVYSTGVVTFTFNLHSPGPAAANDVVVVDYEY